MKKLIVIMMLSFFMAACTPVYAIFGKNKAQVETIPANKPSIKEKAVSWATTTGYVVGISFVFGLFAKKGWSLTIKRLAGKGHIVSKEIGELFLEGSDFLKLLNGSIKEDGKLKENSAKELIQAGKEVIAEAKDVIVVIKPKKT